MLSLRRLLQQADLELTLLVPGEGEGADRELLWLHNTELANPAPYVRPGELVLTNGVARRGRSRVVRRSGAPR